jgi:hypothetical protein
MGINAGRPDGIYISHYYRLRQACFGLMLHGVNFDKANAERLRTSLSLRKAAIKVELVALTNGVKLWSETSHRSEEMVDALANQRQAREALKISRKQRSLEGLKPKQIKLACGEQEALVTTSKAKVSLLRAEGRDRQVTTGTGLSDDKIASYFYDTLGVAKQYKLRKGTKGAKRTVTVDDIALKKIRLATPKLTTLVELIREHRKATKLISNYLDPAKLSADGRLRCMYKTYGTNSGRLSSASNPEGLGLNLQNFDAKLKPLLIPDIGD